MSHLRFRWVRRGVAAVSVVVFAWVLWDGFSSGLTLSPSTALRLTIAVPISTLGLAFAGVSWSRLVGVSWPRGLAAFGSSLPLRHLPLGGVGQVAGLAGLSIAGGSSTKRASQAGPAFLLVTAAGASLVAAPLIWDTEIPWVVRIGVGIAVAASLVLMLVSKKALRFLARWWTAAEGSDELPIARSVLWSAMAAAGAGLAFALLFSDGGSWLRSVSGFSAAWLGGFLFVVAPAGLGAREAVLVSLWPLVESGEVVAFALLHRLSTLIAEGLILLLGLFLSRLVREPSLERT